VSGRAKGTAAGSILPAGVHRAVKLWCSHAITAVDTRLRSSRVCRDLQRLLELERVQMQDLAHLTEVACACNCRRIGPTGYSNAVVPPVTSGRAFACSQHVCAEACRGEAMVSVPVNHKTSCKVSREYRQLQCSICSHFCSNYNAHCPHVQFYRPCRCTSSFQSTSALSWQLQHIDCTGCMLACFHFPCYTAWDPFGRCCM
jgi:hypothetical protein